MDFGSVAEWLAAIIALGAIAASVAAWKVSNRLLKVEEDRDAEAGERERRDHASRVYAWGIRLTGRPGDNWGIFLRNDSSAPVFDVEVRSQKLNGKEENAPLRLSILPPGEYAVPSHPRYHWDNPIEFSRNPEPLEVVARAKMSMVTSIRFTDSAGVRWHVDERRVLTETGPVPVGGGEG